MVKAIVSMCACEYTRRNLHCTGPELFTSMSTLNDQQLGGVLDEDYSGNCIWSRSI